MTVAHAAHMYRIQNWYGSITDGVAAGEFTGGSNPDVLFPPWGRGSLVVAARWGIGPAGGAAVSGTTYPTRFTNGTSTFANGAGADTAIQSAYVRTIDSITDSGAFGGTFSGFSETHSIQVAVRGYPIATVMAGTAFEDLLDDFTTDQLASLWPGSYGTVSVSSGLLHVNADTGYSGAVSDDVYRINGSHIQVQAFPAALNGGTTNVISEMSVNTTTAGTDALFSCNVATGQLGLLSRTGYFDPDGVYITYSAVDHAYWRLRVSGGKMFWDTSPDGSDWTIQRTATAPSWAITDSDLKAQLLGHRDDGTTNTADWDNFNVGTTAITTTTTIVDGKAIVQVDDTESQDDHNVIRTFTNDDNLFDSDLDAAAWADLIISTHADDRPIIRLAFYASKSQGYRMQAIRRRVGHKITLIATNNAGLGISQDFFIENIKHNWSNGNRLWETTWELSPA
jgi:hypothetical protein